MAFLLYLHDLHQVQIKLLFVEVPLLFYTTHVPCISQFLVCQAAELEEVYSISSFD
jgi:hypothetical protein